MTTIYSCTNSPKHARLCVCPEGKVAFVHELIIRAVIASTYKYTRTSTSHTFSVSTSKSSPTPGRVTLTVTDDELAARTACSIADELITGLKGK